MTRKQLSAKEIFDILCESDIEDEDNTEKFPHLVDEDVNDIVEIDKPKDVIPHLEKEIYEDNEVSEQNEPIEAILIAEGSEAEEIVLDETIAIEFLDEFQHTNKTDIQWRRKEFQPEVQRETFNENLNNNIVNDGAQSPLKYFEKYFTSEVFESFAFHTNIYAQQNYVNGFRQINAQEIKILFGLHMLMGCLKFSRLRMYWSAVLNIEIFKKHMTSDRFFQQRNNLHIVNNLEKPNDCKDKFYKVRPLVDAIRRRCNQLPLEENLCIDEQIIPFKGHLVMKQYMKGKPNPWGMKVFILCGKSGIPYDFFLYQGADTGISAINLKRFGFGASVVLHLVQRLPNNNGNNLYFDNYFSSYQLFEILKQKGINAVGTLRVNRFANPPFITDKELAKKGRGATDTVVSRDGKIVLVKWQDNKAIHIGSNFVGIGTTEVVERWDKTAKKYVKICRPEIISRYNLCMGGVDLLDQLISYYRVFIQSKKWPLRVFFHFMDFATCASWLEYRRDCEIQKIPKKNIQDLLAFRMELANSLVSAGKPCNERKKGRPFQIPALILQSKKKRSKKNQEIRPYKDIRFDDIDHMPQHDQKTEPTRCKQIGCKGRTFFYVINARFTFVLINCFSDFHRNKN